MPANQDTNVVAHKSQKTYSSSFISRDKTFALDEKAIMATPIGEHPAKAKVHAEPHNKVQAAVGSHLEAAPKPLTAEEFNKLVAPGQEIARKAEANEKTAAVHVLGDRNHPAESAALTEERMKTETNKRFFDDRLDEARKTHNADDLLKVSCANAQDDKKHANFSKSFQEQCPAVIGLIDSEEARKNIEKFQHAASHQEHGHHAQHKAAEKVAEADLYVVGP